MIELYNNLGSNGKYDVFAYAVSKEMIDICTKTHSKDEAEKSLAISHYISFDYVWVASELLYYILSGVEPTKILDAGSGRGVFQFWLARSFNCDVIALDRRKEHCFNWVLERKEILNVKNITPKADDLISTGLESNSIDIITSTSSFEHNKPEEIQKIFDEMSRVIKKEGHLIFTAVTGLHEKVWETGVATDPIVTIYPIDWWVEVAKNSGFELFDKKVNISEDDVKNAIEDFNLDHPHYANQYVPFGMHLVKS